MIIDVLLPLNLSKCFSYKVPNGLTIKIGDFVEVPFLNKKYIGVVWNNKVKLNEKIKYKIIYKKLPITFPSTTNCKKPCTGGKIIEN